MALRDDVRAGKGTGAALNTRLVTALDPTHVGRAPDLTGSWDEIFALLDALPGVRYRMGSSRMAISRTGKESMFECAISINDGAQVLKPVRRLDLPGDADNKRVVIEAILIAKGL